MASDRLNIIVNVYNTRCERVIQQTRSNPVNTIQLEFLRLVIGEYAADFSLTSRKKLLKMNLLASTLHLPSACRTLLDHHFQQ